jgi:hypothetical protein
MTVTLEHVTRLIDGIPTIRDVSLTRCTTHEAVAVTQNEHTKRRHLEPRNFDVDIAVECLA